MDSPTDKSPDVGSHPALEKHYTVSEVAELWGWSGNTVRKLFRDEAGVLQSNIPSLMRGKKRNVSLRIPESVLLRVHSRFSVSH
jgi:hypothetical protein